MKKNGIISAKWAVPFIPWVTYGISSIRPVPDFGVRLMVTLGTILITVVLLMIVQPWKVDES